MVDKTILIEEVIRMLKPIIKKALNQIPIEHREDLEQELYLKIIKKVTEENLDDLPGFFEMLSWGKEKGIEEQKEKR